MLCTKKHQDSLFESILLTESKQAVFLPYRRENAGDSNSTLLLLFLTAQRIEKMHKKSSCNHCFCSSILIIFDLYLTRCLE